MTAKLDADALVECHGHFRTASCIDCGKPASPDEVKETMIQTAKVPLCQHCQGYVKPDIVFFGEGLPDRFHRLLRQDLPRADGCLILGTSLAVAPVSSIPDLVPRTAKRILLNRELVGNLRPHRKRPAASRDIFYGADCDESVTWLAKCMGWWPELQAMHQEMLDELAVAAAKKKTDPKHALSSKSSSTASS